MQWPEYLSSSLIAEQVVLALAEDVGSGDLTASLVPESALASARLITRESGVLCGKSWVELVFAALDEDISITWHAEDGQLLEAGQLIAEFKGNAQALLTGERTALNFLQMLSGTATLTRTYVQALAGTTAKLLDTRKTIPGHRMAQKYAVLCGGGHNHRVGLYDAVLIKENHIASAGGIAQVLEASKSIDAPVEIEVPSLEALEIAINAGAMRIMLDNFSLADMKTAVKINRGRATLEVSGNVSLDKIQEIAKTGVEYISVGALTKQIQPLDLSLLFEM